MVTNRVFIIAVLRLENCQVECQILVLLVKDRLPPLSLVYFNLMLHICGHGRGPLSPGGVRLFLVGLFSVT